MTPRGRVRCVARRRAPGRPQARQLRAQLRQTSVGGAACGRTFSARLGRCRGARPRVSRCGNVRRLGRRQAALQRGRAVVRPASERGLRGSPSSPALRGAAVPGAGLSDRCAVVRKAVHSVLQREKLRHRLPDLPETTQSAAAPGSPGSHPGRCGASAGGIPCRPLPTTASHWAQGPGPSVLPYSASRRPGPRTRTPPADPSGCQTRLPTRVGHWPSGRALSPGTLE